MKTLAALIVFPLLALLASPQIVEAQDQASAISDGEIRQLLAPIALYPDVLLSQILIAATYPLEVVEAARWSLNNPGLEGQAAVDAVASMDWDPSIKALVAFPDLLARMSEELDWTRRLGDAFLLQEEAVYAAIQDLRERAEAAGSLDRLDHARAYRDGDVIVIEPADSQIVYVPYYSPRIVYGGWWWSGYPPYYWYPPTGYYPAAGFYWGTGIALYPGYFISSFDWRYNHIAIKPHHHHRYGYSGNHKWRHDPKHRRGVAYREPALNRQFGRTASSGKQIQAPRAQESAPRSRSALSRHSDAYYNSGSDRRTGSTAPQRLRRESTTAAEVPDGNRSSALRRSTDDRAQRSAQDTGASADRESGERNTSGMRSDDRSTGPSTRLHGSAMSEQRSSFGSRSPSQLRDISPGTSRPAASGDGGSRGSALGGGRR